MDHGGAHELVHWAAAVVLVIGGAFVLALSARAHRFDLADTTLGRDKPRIPHDPIERSTLVILAGLSLGAATIHLAAAPSHYSELGDLGAGFLVAALLQAVWARAILRSPSRRAIAWGIAVNAAIVAAWAVSRTVGLTPGSPEPIGLPDGASVVFEVLLLVGLVVRRLDGDRRAARRFSPARPLLAVAVVPVLGLVMLTASLASLAIVAGAEHGAPGPAAPHAEVMRSGSAH